MQHFKSHQILKYPHILNLIYLNISVKKRTLPNLSYENCEKHPEKILSYIQARLLSLEPCTPADQSCDTMTSWQVQQHGFIRVTSFFESVLMRYQTGFFQVLPKRQTSVREFSLPNCSCSEWNEKHCHGMSHDDMMSEWSHDDVTMRSQWCHDEVMRNRSTDV